MKIAVLAGGLSTERNVSFSTGNMVCRALREKGHQAVLLDLFMGLEGYQGDLSSFFDAPDGHCTDAVISSDAPDLEAVRNSRQDQSQNLFGDRVLEICQMADIVFLALHGACGEDGRVQATFDLMGIPYTGAGYLGSAMAMNKAITKRMMDHAGVPNAPWKEIRLSEDTVEELAQSLQIPCAVKTIGGGSSIGVALPETREELRDALQSLIQYGESAITEQRIYGREFSVGVLGDRALPPIEIIPEEGFYDYATKYQKGLSRDVCPAEIPQEVTRRMQQAALALHRELGLEVYSRSDFLMDENGDIYCLEINTLPGMTPMSLLPQEAMAVGISYADLCQWIVEESMRLRGSEKR